MKARIGREQSEIDLNQWLNEISQNHQCQSSDRYGDFLRIQVEDRGHDLSYTEIIKFASEEDAKRGETAVLGHKRFQKGSLSRIDQLKLNRE